MRMITMSLLVLFVIFINITSGYHFSEHGPGMHSENKMSAAQAKEALDKLDNFIQTRPKKADFNIRETVARLSRYFAPFNATKRGWFSHLISSPLDDHERDLVFQLLAAEGQDEHKSEGRRFAAILLALYPNVDGGNVMALWHNAPELINKYGRPIASNLSQVKIQEHAASFCDYAVTKYQKPRDLLHTFWDPKSAERQYFNLLLEYGDEATVQKMHQDAAKQLVDRPDWWAALFLPTLKDLFQKHADALEDCKHDPRDPWSQLQNTKAGQKFLTEFQSLMPKKHPAPADRFLEESLKLANGIGGDHLE